MFEIVLSLLYWVFIYLMTKDKNPVRYVFVIASATFMALGIHNLLG
jgi:hypothetical protein